MSIRSRIIEYIQYSNMTNRAFEVKCGLSNGYINNILKGIGVDKLSQIAFNCPDLDIGWLMSGDGKMIRDRKFSDIELNQEPMIAIDKLLAMLEEKDRQLSVKDEQISKKDEQISILLKIIEGKENFELKKGGAHLRTTLTSQVKDSKKI